MADDRGVVDISTAKQERDDQTKREIAELRSGTTPEEFAALAGVYTGLANLIEVTHDRTDSFQKFLRWTTIVAVREMGEEAAETAFKKALFFARLYNSPGPDAA